MIPHHKIVSSIPVFKSYVGFQFTSVFKRSTLTPTNKGSSLEKGIASSLIKCSFSYLFSDDRS